jgi:hypothetical protein
MTKRQPPRVTEHQAREAYLSDAAYYWLRATGADENMLSALHRMNASTRRAVLEAHGWAIPTRQEIYKRAVAIFGADHCHEAPNDKEAPNAT